MIAVKRDEGGRGGSVSLVDGVKAGDTLEVSEPRNLFELTQRHRAIFSSPAAYGITPDLVDVHWVRAHGDKPFRLYYLTRNAAGTAFLAELSGIDLTSKVTIHHDEGSRDKAFDLWPVFEAPTKAHIYCCGPRPTMDAVKDMTGHWPAHQVHFEDFGSDLVRHVPTTRPSR